MALGRPASRIRLPPSTVNSVELQSNFVAEIALPSKRVYCLGLKTVIALFAGSWFAFSAFAGSPAHEKVSWKSEPTPQIVEETVFVTGSLIPRRIQVQRIGTTTESPLRVIDRREIDQTGRLTIPGAFVNEPAVRIIGH